MGFAFVRFEPHADPSFAELYLIGLCDPMRSAFTLRELRTISEVAAERELRMLVPLEDAVEAVAAQEMVTEEEEDEESD